MSDTLVYAEHVSKKFCRSLKRSLWYGVTDVVAALSPFGRDPSSLLSDASSAPPLRPDEFWAVRDVSFELKRGECLGLIGHNGAGKSTLLRMLNGLIPPDAGRIALRGRVGALIELNAGFNPILTGRENIFNQAALLGFGKTETQAKFDAIVDFADIGDFLDMPVQNYSSGMRVRLGFAVAVQMEPDILLIDEVLAVGDVAFRFKCLSAIGELMKSAAVIFVTHTMPQVFHVCSELAVLDHGRTTFHGRNLAKGVGVYLSLLQGSAQHILGSGEVQVLGLEMEHPRAGTVSMGDTLVVPYGSSLVLRARVRGSSQLRKARLQFLFWNAEMLPVMDIMAGDLKGHVFELPSAGELEITARIPRVDLNAGKYTVSAIAISEDQMNVLCRHDNAAYLQVEADSASGAYVLTSADWSVVASVS